MPLPNRDTLLGLEFSSFGEPFANIVSKSTIDTLGLEASYLGEPFQAFAEFTFTNLSGEVLMVGLGILEGQAFLESSYSPIIIQIGPLVLQT